MVTDVLHEKRARLDVMRLLRAVDGDRNFHGESPRLVVLLIRLTIVSKVRSGRPRQFIEMKENRRCSILFHLLVPGG